MPWSRQSRIWIPRCAIAGAGLGCLDLHLFFSQSGFEEFSGFGPIGTIAMATILFACLHWRPKTVWWRLAAAAFLGLTLVSFIVGFNIWANRYRISWYTLGTIAAVCALWECETPLRRVIRWMFATIAITSALAAPLLSFNRRPIDIIASIRDRDRFETCHYPVMGKIRERLRSLRAEKPDRRIFFIACNTRWCCRFLKTKNWM